SSAPSWMSFTWAIEASGFSSISCWTLSKPSLIFCHSSLILLEPIRFAYRFAIVVTLSFLDDSQMIVDRLTQLRQHFPLPSRPRLQHVGDDTAELRHGLRQVDFGPQNVFDVRHFAPPNVCLKGKTSH